MRYLLNADKALNPCVLVHCLVLKPCWFVWRCAVSSHCTSSVWLQRSIWSCGLQAEDCAQGVTGGFRPALFSLLCPSRFCRSLALAWLSIEHACYNTKMVGIEEKLLSLSRLCRQAVIRAPLSWHNKLAQVQFTWHALLWAK